MIEPELIGFLKEWGAAGFLAVACVSLWRKVESQEKRLAEMVDKQTTLLMDSIKHIERNSILLERLEKHGGD